MSSEFPSGKLTPEEQTVRESFDNRKKAISEALERLQRNEVGRGIVRKRFDRKSLIGYILPLDSKNNSHLIIFNDGYMALTGVDSNESVAELYREQTAQDVNEYIAESDRPADILQDLVSGTGTITLTNESQASTPQFEEAAKKALVEIRRRLLERKRALMETTGAVTGTLNSMLGDGILV